jgi:uncharacterized membrane protein HdeD (DUF308 family)
MLERVTQHWWILLLRGIVSLALGILAILLPGLTAVALALLFGAYALIDGVLAIAAALRMSHAGGRWIWLLTEGIAGVVFGVAALVYPGISLLVLVVLIAAWAFVTGAAAITTAWQLRKMVAGEWFWILSGALSIVFAVWVALQPIAGVLALVYIFAFYAILTGITFVGLSFRLRAARQTPPTLAGHS